VLTDPEAARAVSERQQKHVAKWSFDHSAEVLEGIIEAAFKRGAK